MRLLHQAPSRAVPRAGLQPAGAGKPPDPLMQAIRTLGRLPKSTRKATKDERQLAENLRRAKLSGEERSQQ